MVDSSWRGHVVTLDLLLHFVLANEVLVPGRVVVVWEELGQQQIHVLATLAVALRATRSTLLIVVL